MKNMTLFYLEDCPYCYNARKALAELMAKNPAYAEISVDWIEESRQAALAGQYDYYYVPAIFAGGKKLYEAHPGESYAACREQVRAALDAVLRS